MQIRVFETLVAATRVLLFRDGSHIYASVLHIMEVRLIVGVCAAVSLVIGLVLLVTLFGGINLTEYITQLAVGLTLLILGIIYWTFRPKIDQWLGSEPSIKVSSNQCGYYLHMQREIQT